MIVVRDARPADWEELSALWRIIDDLHARLLPTYFRKPTRAPTRDQVLRMIHPSAEEVVRVAARDDLVIGVIHVQIFETPPKPALTPRRRAHIDSLVVAEGARRAGVARRLVDDAAHWARGRGADELVLTVWAGNEAAEKFYASLGFGGVSAVLGRAL